MNKCAFEQTVREALPDFFADFAKRFPPTEENRHATADAYLAMDRGFDLGKIRGWYEQDAHQIYGTASWTKSAISSPLLTLTAPPQK